MRIDDRDYPPGEAREVVEWLHRSVRLTYRSISDLIGVSERTLHYWRRTGREPYFRHRFRLYLLAELRETNPPGW